MNRIIEMLAIFFGRDVETGDPAIHTAEEVETRSSRRMLRRRRRTATGKTPEEGEQGRLLLTVERAVQIIDALPSDVPREGALRIVRGTLAAIGIEVSELQRFARARVSKLRWEIELARDRQKEIREKTEEAIRSLEEEIRKAKEDCDVILAEEEKKITEISSALKDVGRVTDFFDIPRVAEKEENIDVVDQDTQPLKVLGR